jgi:dTDP-4-dehydrorhamnose 3,5-epimerase
MAFTFKECLSSGGTSIEALFEAYPRVFEDSRGYFFEGYSERDFFAGGLKERFVQDNQSCKGV